MRSPTHFKQEEPGFSQVGASPCDEAHRCLLKPIPTSHLPFSNLSLARVTTTPAPNPFFQSRPRLSNTVAAPDNTSPFQTTFGTVRLTKLPWGWTDPVHIFKDDSSTVARTTSQSLPLDSYSSLSNLSLSIPLSRVDVSSSQDTLSCLDSISLSQAPSSVSPYAYESSSTPLASTFTLSTVNKSLSDLSSYYPSPRKPLSILAAKKKYKPVALKTRPVMTELPERFRITRNILGDPLETLPILPKHPEPFRPYGRYTLK